MDDSVYNALILCLYSTRTKAPNEQTLKPFRKKVS